MSQTASVSAFGKMLNFLPLYRVNGRWLPPSVFPGIHPDIFDYDYGDYYIFGFALVFIWNYIRKTHSHIPRWKVLLTGSALIYIFPFIRIIIILISLLIQPIIMSAFFIAFTKYEYNILIHTAHLSLLWFPQDKTYRFTIACFILPFLYYNEIWCMYFSIAISVTYLVQIIYTQQPPIDLKSSKVQVQSNNLYAKYRHVLFSLLALAISIFADTFQLSIHGNHCFWKNISIFCRFSIYTLNFFKFFGHMEKILTILSFFRLSHPKLSREIDLTQIGMILSGLTGILIKVFTHRIRPFWARRSFNGSPFIFLGPSLNSISYQNMSHLDWSLPSGHAMVTSAGFTVFSYLITPQTNKIDTLNPFSFPLIVQYSISFLTGFARILWEMHWTSDVVFGLIAGQVCGLLFLQLLHFFDYICTRFLGFSKASVINP